MKIKPKIYSRFDLPDAKPNCAGNRLEPQYIEKTNEKGIKYLEKTGEIDTYEIIQSHADECNMSLLIQRYAAGDKQIAARIGKGLEGDLTDMPQSITEAMNMLDEQKARFDQLPTEIKQKFGNDWKQYAAEAGTESWFNKIAQQKDKQPSNNLGETTKEGEKN